MATTVQFENVGLRYGTGGRTRIGALVRDFRMVPHQSVRDGMRLALHIAGLVEAELVRRGE